jgi:N-acetylmuramoyl-L-alanine amidase
MNIRLIPLIFFAGLLFAGRIQVCLDPGHGGTDPGTVNDSHGPDGPYEKDFNFYIANVCYNDLTWGLGYSVIMTRTGDTLVKRDDRAKMANGEIPNPSTGTKDTCWCTYSNLGWQK